MLRAIELLELLSDLEGAVRGAIVDNDYLPVQFAIGRRECQLLIPSRSGTGLSHFSLNVFWISQIMIGRFRRSL